MCVCWIWFVWLVVSFILRLIFFTFARSFVRTFIHSFNSSIHSFYLLWFVFKQSQSHYIGLTTLCNNKHFIGMCISTCLLLLLFCCGMCVYECEYVESLRVFCVRVWNANTTNTWPMFFCFLTQCNFYCAVYMYVHMYILLCICVYECMCFSTNIWDGVRLFSIFIVKSFYLKNKRNFLRPYPRIYSCLNIYIHTYVHCTCSLCVFLNLLDKVFL